MPTKLHRFKPLAYHHTYVLASCQREVTARSQLQSPSCRLAFLLPWVGMSICAGYSVMALWHALGVRLDSGCRNICWDCASRTLTAHGCLRSKRPGCTWWESMLRHSQGPQAAPAEVLKSSQQACKQTSMPAWWHCAPSGLCDQFHPHGMFKGSHVLCRLFWMHCTSSVTRS